jgi:hypothetical protein
MMKSIEPTQLKILLPLLFCCLLLSQAYSQGIKLSGGAVLKAQGAISLKTSGGAGISADNTSRLSLEAQSGLLLDGNLSLNGAATELNGSVILQGSAVQTISANGEVSIQALTIDNSAGLTLQTPLLVRGALELVKGNINTTEQNLLTLDSRLTFNKGSATSYVNGFMAIRTQAASGGSYDFTFPIGTASGYFPARLKFKQNNASSTSYSVGVLSSDFPDHQLGEGIKSISSARYWKVSNANATNFSEAEITLPLAAADGIAASEALVVKASDKTWESIGGKNAVVPGTITSSVAFNSLGDFTVATRQVAPSFTLSAASVTEDEDFEGTKSVTITPDAATPAADYSFNPALNTILFAEVSYDMANRRVNVASLPNASGTASITVTATDKSSGSNTFSRSLSLTVNAVNDAPTVAKPLPDVEVGENAAPLTIGIEEVFADVEEASLSYDVASGDENLFTVALNGSSTAMVLSFVPGQVGSSSLTLGAEDSGGKRAEQTITVTVVPPDAPVFTLSAASLDEEEDFEGIRTVTISPNEGTPAADYSFSPGLDEVELVNVSYDEETKMLSISAVENAFGFVNLAITATDKTNSENSSTKTLVITVDAVNDPPLLLEALADVSFPQNTEPQLIDIAGVFTDPDDSRLVYTVENTNTDLLTVTVNGQELILTFAAGVAGEADITLIAQDEAGVTVSDQFRVTVEEEAGNIPPVADAGPDQTVIDRDNEGSASVTFDGSGSTDPDGEIVAYTWTKGDGEVIASGVNPSASLPLGDYEIVLTVEDNLGSIARDTLALSVQSEADPGDDDDPPSLPVINVPATFAIDGTGELILSVNAVDENGIVTSQFGLKGLTSEEELVLADISGDGPSFQVARPVSELTAIDPLGIEYTFYFADAAGNNTTYSGYIYWTYENTAFSNTDLNWRELGNRTTYFNNDFNIIAFPFESQRVSGVLGGLGTAADTAWRLFRHEAGTENFAEYGKSSFSANGNFEPGEGYFLIMRDADNIRFGGKTAEMEDYDDQLAHEITLRNGWNLIGNPFPFPIDWQLVEAHPLNEDVNFVQPLQRLRAGNTNRDYDDSAPQLNAFEGAFLFWDGSGNDKLYLSPSVRLANSARYEAQLAARGWELPITIEQGGWQSSRAGVGMRSGAAEGLDYYDAMRVPKLREQAELLITQAAYQLNRSVVPELASYRWMAEIAGIGPDAEVTLKWDNEMVAALGRGLYLWDAGAYRLVDMSVEASYTLDTSPGNNPQLQIYFGTKEDFFAGLEVDMFRAGQPFPNPVLQHARLPLSLPADMAGHEVSLSLYDSRGQEVRRYSFGALGAGYHELEMELSEGLSSGLYHYRLIISGAHTRMLSGKFIRN